MDRVAIVTGGAAGIGRGLCRELAARGATVVVADRDGTGAQRVCASVREYGGRAHAAQLDVAVQEQVEGLVGRVVGEHGRLDYMVNNAGYALVGELRDVSVDELRRLVDVNLMGVVYGSAAAYAVMRERGRGHIVNIASLAGLIGFQTMTPYAMTKAAVVAYTQGLRVEAATFGVRATAVCPGFVESSIYENATTFGVPHDQVRKLVPFRPISTERAVNEIVYAIERNRALSVFPAYGRLLWRLTRLAPAASVPFSQKLLRELREVRQKT